MSCSVRFYFVCACTCVWECHFSFLGFFNVDFKMGLICWNKTERQEYKHNLTMSLKTIKVTPAGTIVCNYLDMVLCLCLLGLLNVTFLTTVPKAFLCPFLLYCTMPLCLHLTLLWVMWPSQNLCCRPQETTEDYLLHCEIETA